MLKQTKLQFWQSLISAIAAGASLYVTAPLAGAADATPSFSSLDANQDGFIDRNEAAVNQALSQAFDAADANKDGRLTPAEFSKAFSVKK